MTRAVQKTPGKESGSWSRRPDLRRIGKRSGAGWISALVLLALTAAGCASLQPDKTTPAARHDTAVRNEKIRGLNFEILDFSWYYLPQTDRIQISGRAQNRTGESVQAVRLLVTVFDQNRKPLGTTFAFLNPTYIKPDQIARFEFSVNGSESVAGLRLEYYFQIQN